ANAVRAAFGIPIHTWNTSSVDNDVGVTPRPVSCNAGCTIFAVATPFAKPGADAVIVADAGTGAPSTPCTTKLTSNALLGTKRSNDAVPGVVAFGDTSAMAALLLAMCIVTPPCCVAPSRAVNNPSCRPAPTMVLPDEKPIIEMPGPLIVTATDAAVVAMKPGIVADTVVFPGVDACTATPPVATVLADNDCPAGTDTVTV